MNKILEYKFCGLCTICKKGKLIGSGGSGTVYECTNNKHFVIKEADAKDLENEVKFIKYDKNNKFKHVAKLFNVETNNNAIIIEKINFILSDNLSILDFDDLYSNPTKYLRLHYTQLTPSKIEYNEDIIFKLIDSIKYLHSNVGYSHNDIKPSNVGYNIYNNNTKQIKYIDMGSSRLIDKNKEGTQLKTLGYTLMYASQSTISGIFTNTKRDMWAIAATIFEIVAGIPLFHTLSNQSFIIYVTLIIGIDNESKLKHILGINEDDDEDGFTILSPFKNENDIVSRHLGMSRMCFLNSKYPNKKAIISFLYDAFKDDIDFNNQNNQNVSGGKALSHQIDTQNTSNIGVFDKQNTLLQNNNIHQKKSKATFVYKQNPLLNKHHIYDFNTTTGKITIKNMVEWKKIINQIKNDIKLYESSEQYHKDKYKYFNNFQKQINIKNPQHLLIQGGRVYERKVITEDKYNTEKYKDNKNVSRYKLKNGGFVYYIKKFRN